MANPEHLKILKQGVKAWNRWRNSKGGSYPDLSKADLSGLNLEGIDLNTSDLSRSSLKGTILYNADLSYSNLRNANLLEGKLSRAILADVELNEADLTKANLEDADLYDADLTDAKLVKTNLSRARLEGVTLHRANLSGASLFQANLQFSDLSLGDLTDVDLRWVDCVLVNFEKATLRNANLSFCNLVQSNLTGAILTGAKLYGTARDNWIIKGVECKYVYWDEEGKQRSPKDRDLEPGEFERLYAALPTIEYIFENGMTPMDPLIMDRVVQAIRKKRPEFDIKIDSINARGLAPSIKFTVQQKEHKKPALAEVQKGYEDRISRLETEKERLYDLLGQAIDKAGDVRLITSSIVAMDNATINIEQNIHNALELQKAITDEPEESKSFAKVVKKTALDIIGGAIKDIAKGQVKKAAKEIIKLGKDLGPIIVKTAAYGFFKSMLQ